MAKKKTVAKMGDIDMNNSSFAYTAAIKLNELPVCRAKEEFPGVADLAVNSRSFANYYDCSNSVRKFMESVVDHVNNDLPEDQQFMVSAEVNPVYSGVDTKSKDWSTGELARLWMFEIKQEEAHTIHAVGQARVFMTARESEPALN